MKRFILSMFTLLAAIVSSGSFAGTVIDAGSFSSNGDTYSSNGDTYVQSPYSGIFTDVIQFNVDSAGITLIFAGSHTGMAADQMLLTNTSDGAEYHLGSVFSESLKVAQGSNVFTISGFGANALDSKIISDYDLSISAVPLPAAAWLFASALIGFISFSVRRRI